MNKKLLIIIGLVGISVISIIGISGAIILLAKNNQSENNNNETNFETLTNPSLSYINPCSPEEIEIEGYGDKGKVLTSCFVEYPGEPTRENNYYFIVEDICGQFTETFIENMLGRDIISIEEPSITSLYNCEYTTSEDPKPIGTNFLIALEYMDIENQKKGQELIGREVKSIDSIDMKNYVVYDGDEINTIYLGLSANKFISINPNSENTFTSNEEFIEFVTNLSEEIKNYK